jgi:uncharacterized protein YecE (DUF72 family)
MVYIGTSGWTYKSWANAFYPSGLPAADQLKFYASKFPAVEINRSFYRLPTETAFAGWRRQAPPGFMYAMKGSRAVTHFKRLRPGARSLDLLLDRSRALHEHLGPILWQLPPTLKKDSDRLRGFLQTLDRGFRHAIEFRHPSWLSDDVFELLKEHRVAQVALSSQAMPMRLEITAKFIYVRFHGLAGGAAHDYSDNELRPWAKFLRGSAEEHLPAFVFFNNDANSRAPQNAQRLMQLVGPAAAVVPDRGLARKNHAL